MRIILTGPKGNLGYFDAQTPKVGGHAFGFQGRFKHHARQSFAGQCGFATNNNHAPRGSEGAVTSDMGLDLLHRIAGA